MTVEEIEIIVKGNVEDALNKIEGLKTKINSTLSQAMRPIQQVNTSIKSSGMTQNLQKISNNVNTATSKASKQMEILSREIEIQQNKIQGLTKEYEYQKNIVGKKNLEKYGPSAEMEDTANKIKKAQIQLDKLKLRYETICNKSVPKMKDSTEKVSKAMQKTSKSSNMLTKSFKLMIIAMAIRTVIKQAIQGFKDLAQYSTKFNKTMSNLQASFLQARNSIAVAFAPVLQALEPVITTVTNLIINLFNALSKFNTALFSNSKTYMQAKKVTTDYAKSIANAKKSLAGFDELNVLSDQQTQQGMPTAQEMFSTEKIDEQTLNITEKIKRAISQTIADGKKQISSFITWFDTKFHITDLVSKTANLFANMWNSIQKTYNKWCKPIFDSTRTAISKTVDTISLLWDTTILPIINSVIDFIGIIWENLMDFLGNLINFTLILYNNVVLPIIDFLIKLLGPTISDVVQDVLMTVGNVINAIITVFNGLIDFLMGVFTGNWQKAWDGIKAIFKGVWDGITSIVKGVVNIVIDLVNGMLSAMEKGLNFIIKKINTLSWEVPEWVPGIGGQTWGFNISTVTFDKIPRLANGGILTEPTPVLAGEYPGAKSNPEIVTPQSLMYETNLRANVPVLNAIEEMTDRLVEAFSNVGVYAEFGYDKMIVGLDNAKRKRGAKLYGV